jgi:hypothetical protein
MYTIDNETDAMRVGCLQPTEIQIFKLRSLL